MQLKLVEVDRHSAKERKEAVDFINSNLELGLPLEDETIRTGKVVMFWALYKGERVGMTGYFHKTKFLAESAKTVVDPMHRGKGLGVVLSQAIEDEIRRRGYKKVVTAIYVTNLPMIFIKLRQGYLFEGIHRDHDAPGLHEYSMGKVFVDADKRLGRKPKSLNKTRAR